MAKAVIGGKMKQMMGGLLNASQESKVLAKGEIKEALYNLISREKWLAPGIASKPVNGTAKRDGANRDDREFTLLITHKDDNIPVPVLALLKETMLGFEKNEIDAFVIRYYMGFKNTETVIPAPSDRVLSRTIYNVGNKEIYHFETGSEAFGQQINETVKSKTGGIGVSLDGRAMLIPADSYLCLGYRDICNYKVTVKGNAPRRTPEAISYDQNRQIKPTLFIRPTNYHRLTIVVDLEGDKSILEEVSADMTDRIGKTSLGDMRKAVDTLLHSATSSDQSDLDKAISKKELRKIGALMGDKKGEEDKEEKEKSVILEEKDIESML